MCVSTLKCRFVGIELSSWTDCLNKQGKQGTWTENKQDTNRLIVVANEFSLTTERSTKP